jgi:hypothetical protein
VRLRVTAMALLAGLVLVAAGCGSEQRDLLARALRQPVNDARFSMVMSMTQSGGELVRVTLDGPYHCNAPNQLPSFDFAVHFALTTLGSTKDVAFRLISTSDDVFVRYDGATYEVGKDRVAAYTRRAVRNAKRFGNLRTLGDFKRLGLHIESWFPDSQVVGGETIGGDRVTHLHGRIDVAAIVKDFTKLMSDRSLNFGMGTGPGTNLTPEMKRQVEKAITNPTFDVYVDKASGGFRRLAGQAGIDIPGAPRFGINMRFDILDAGRPQTITAPSSGRPITELLDHLKQKYGIDFGAALAGAA